jgi:hypothetical protein
MIRHRAPLLPYKYIVCLVLPIIEFIINLENVSSKVQLFLKWKRYSNPLYSLSKRICKLSDLHCIVDQYAIVIVS